MRLEVHRNGHRLGAAHGAPMAFGFDQLVAHADYSRHAVAGTLVGSDTVSNDDYRIVGPSCIAERRAIEMLDEGQPNGPFGVIDQRVVESHGAKRKS